MGHKRGLPPLINSHSTHIILGSLPSDKSIEAGEYYANKRNQFWKILSEVYGEPLPDDYKSRCQYLLAKGIALWDVLEAADRCRSLDSEISNAVPNDLEGLFRDYPSLQKVGFNGRKAESLFCRHFFGEDVCPKRPKRLELKLLPSSSSALARPLEEKVKSWRAFLLH